MMIDLNYEVTTDSIKLTKHKKHNKKYTHCNTFGTNSITQFLKCIQCYPILT